MHVFGFIAPDKLIPVLQESQVEIVDRSVETVPQIFGKDLLKKKPNQGENTYMIVFENHS